MKHHVLPNVEMNKDENHGVPMQTKIVETSMIHVLIIFY